MKSAKIETASGRLSVLSSTVVARALHHYRKELLEVRARIKRGKFVSKEWMIDLRIQSLEELHRVIADCDEAIASL